MTRDEFMKALIVLWEGHEIIKDYEGVDSMVDKLEDVLEELKNHLKYMEDK